MWGYFAHFHILFRFKIFLFSAFLHLAAACLVGMNHHTPLSFSSFLSSFALVLLSLMNFKVWPFEREVVRVSHPCSTVFPKDSWDLLTSPSDCERSTQFGLIWASSCLLDWTILNEFSRDFIVIFAMISSFLIFSFRDCLWKRKKRWERKDFHSSLWTKYSPIETTVLLSLVFGGKSREKRRRRGRKKKEIEEACNPLGRYLLSFVKIPLMMTSPFLLLVCCLGLFSLGLTSDLNGDDSYGLGEVTVKSLSLSLFSLSLFSLFHSLTFFPLFISFRFSLSSCPASGVTCKAIQPDWGGSHRLGEFVASPFGDDSWEVSRQANRSPCHTHW